MIRLLLVALIIYAVYRYLKPRWGIPQEKRGGDGETNEAELIKDPQCGAYFLRHQGVSARIDGEKLYFCSPECRDAYAARRRKEPKDA
jgi:YHS domain-containing protein